MEWYCIKPLDADGTPTPGRNFPCDDDGAALASARKRMKGDARAEVWQGARLVGIASRFSVWAAT